MRPFACVVRKQQLARNIVSPWRHNVVRLDMTQRAAHRDLRTALRRAARKAYTAAIAYPRRYAPLWHGAEITTADCDSGGEDNRAGIPLPFVFCDGGDIKRDLQSFYVRFAACRSHQRR